MSEFTDFCVEGKEDSRKKKVAYAVMSLLNIGRAICQGHFSIE